MKILSSLIVKFSIELLQVKFINCYFRENISFIRKNDTRDSDQSSINVELDFSSPFCSFRRPILCVQASVFVNFNEDWLFRFLKVPCVGLRSVIVDFPCHTHLHLEPLCELF